MRLLEHSETGEIQSVESTDGYGEEWIDRGEIPEGVDPMLVRWALDAIVEDTTPAKAALIDAVNRIAEDIRARFLTQGSGQAMTYLRKEDEARRFESGADPAAFPFLSAEADATGASLADTATLVLAQANAWATLGAAIEGHRRGLIVAINAAEEMAALAAIDIMVGWPTGSEDL